MRTANTTVFAPDRAANGSAARFDAVIAFLANPANHNHPVGDVRIIETHTAVVVLAGPVAYKVKRPVRLPFLDFSTLEARRKAAIAELRINMRTAPELYLGVVPITRDERGRLAIAGAGEAIEWAVKMVRFADDALLSVRADRGLLTVEDAAAIGQAIFAFHAQCERRIARDDATLAHAKLIRQNAEAWAQAPDVFPPDQARALTAQSFSALDRLGPRIRQRALHGAVRRGHGDLHLANMIWRDGQVRLFDAIEFDEAIATVDVLDDLAFFLMDLWQRDLTAHANVALNTYVGAERSTLTMAGLGCLPLFMANRASIRAKVAATRAGLAKSSEVRSTAEAEARRYFSLACALISGAPARLIAVGGLSGTGKSRLAQALAPQVGAAPGALVLRSDVERKRVFGRLPHEPLSHDAYTASTSRMVYAVLRRKCEIALDAGWSVVIDAVNADPHDRAAWAQIAKRAGAGFAGLWLEAPLATRLARVERREGDASDADGRVVTAQETRGLAAVGDTITAEGWQVVNADQSPDAVIAAARTILGA